MVGKQTERMKFYLTSLSSDGYVDGFIRHICDNLGWQSTGFDQADLVIIGTTLTFVTHFKDDSGLADKMIKTQKPVIVMDYIEYGPQQVIRPHAPDHIFGINSDEHRELFRDHQDKYLWIDWVVQNSNVKAYFKRELPIDSKCRAKWPIFPVEYCSELGFPPIASYGDFTARTISVLSLMSHYSNANRVYFNSEICATLAKNHIGIGKLLPNTNFCFSPEDVSLLPDQQKVVIFTRPHNVRIPPQEMLDWQNRSKIVVSIAGAGHKCFRDAEAPGCAVMARQQNPLLWSVPWIDGQNCIELPMMPGEPILDSYGCMSKLDYWLSHPKELYEVYLAGRQTNEHYRKHNYIGNYIKPKITSVL